MPITVDEKVMGELLDHVEGTSKLLEKQAQIDAEVAKRGPAVVDTLIKQGFLNENQRAKALEAVKDPLKVLDSLQKTAMAAAGKPASAAEPPKLGQGGSIKEAGVESRSTVSDPSSRQKSAALDDANRRFLTTFGFNVA